MPRRWKKPSVLAEISGSRPDGGRAWGLRRGDLESLGTLLEMLDETRVVLFSDEGGGGPQAAVGLATAAGAAGRRTVLLECDLARPGLAAALGLKPVPGLHEYLRWEAEASQIVQSAVLAGPESGGATAPLVCIAGGEATTEGGTLLSSESFSHAIAKLRNAYDLVVIGGPPLDRDGASLAALAAQADTTLACVGRERASGKALRELRSTLRRRRLRVRGLVVVE